MVQRKRIFLAHVTEDQAKAQQLYDQLEAEGFLPWMDAVDLMPVQNWRCDIPRDVKNAAICLTCFSKRSVANKEYVQQKFRHALWAYADVPPNTIYLIPIRLDDCEVPDLRLPELKLDLRNLHWVDLFEPDGFDRLVAAIRLNVVINRTVVQA